MSSSRRNFLALLASGICGGIGCATSKTASYQATAPSATARTVTESGLEVTLDPFIEKARSEQYFRIDAVSEGLAILHVRVTNRTSDKTLLLEKKNVRLVPRGESAARAAVEKKIDRSTGGAERAEMVGTLALSLPLRFAAGAVVSRAAEIRRNFVEKEFQDQTLGPGQSAEGFIYFTPVTKGLDWSAGAAIGLSLVETKTRNPIQLTVPLSR